MTEIFNKKEYKKKRQYLRNNMTKAEILLWSKLKNKQMNGMKFRRQYGIKGYTVDFYCPGLRLAIEIDGGVHYHNSRIESDVQREKDIESLGIKVLRYTNIDVLKNMKGVLQDIIIKTTPQSPPSQGGDKGVVKNHVFPVSPSQGGDKGVVKNHVFPVSPSQGGDKGVVTNRNPSYSPSQGGDEGEVKNHISPVSPSQGIVEVLLIAPLRKLTVGQNLRWTKCV